MVPSSPLVVKPLSLPGTTVFVSFCPIAQTPISLFCKTVVPLSSSLFNAPTSTSSSPFGDSYRSLHSMTVEDLPSKSSEPYRRLSSECVDDSISPSGDTSWSLSSTIVETPTSLSGNTLRSTLSETPIRPPKIPISPIEETPTSPLSNRLIAMPSSLPAKTVSISFPLIKPYVLWIAPSNMVRDNLVKEFLSLHTVLDSAISFLNPCLMFRYGFGCSLWYLLSVVLTAPQFVASFVAWHSIYQPGAFLSFPCSDLGSLSRIIFPAFRIRHCKFNTF